MAIMQAKKAIKKLKKQGFFGIKEVLNAGISKATLSRLVAKEKLFRVGHGLYIHPESNIPAEIQDYVRARSKFGSNSIIGGLTALSYYHLTQHVPQQIWVIVPQKKQTRDNFYRLIRVKKIKNSGIVKHKYFSITNIERTIVEAFQYAGKIGLRTAMAALIKAIEENKTDLNKIMAMARKLGQQKMMKKHWETIIGALQR